MPFILTIAKDINGLILSLDYAEREQNDTKFQLAKGDGDKVHEPKGSFTG